MNTEQRIQASIHITAAVLAARTTPPTNRDLREAASIGVNAANELANTWEQVFTSQPHHRSPHPVPYGRQR